MRKFSGIYFINAERFRCLCNNCMIRSGTLSKLEGSNGRRTN